MGDLWEEAKRKELEPGLGKNVSKMDGGGEDVAGGKVQAECSLTRMLKMCFEKNALAGHS